MKFIERVRLYIKSKIDLINNEKVKKNLFNAFPFWVGAFISGGIAVLYAKLFALAETATQLIFQWESWSFIIITPLCFLLAWWVVIKYAPYSRGSGIPQVSAAIELSNPRYHYKVNSLLSVRIIIVKIVSSLIMVFGGGAIGREGPTIQISASVFKKINDLLPDWYPKISKRNMIVTGAAAGLASAFNTPLGGIVFAIEELTKTHFSYFKSALLTGVIIAGLTALYFLGPYLYIGYPRLDDLSPLIIITIIPLAIVTGIIGSMMGSAILILIRDKNTLKKQFQKVLYVALCGLLMATIAVLVDFKIFGSGKEIMVGTLFTDEKHVAWYLPLLRMFGPVISFSTGVSGGIFAPALSAGASIGAAFAGWLSLSDSEANLMILCGMTGCLTSITRSPFTCSILVLEMTNSHNVIFYIMLTALLANLIGKMVSRHSFYDQLRDQYVHEILKDEAREVPQH